MGRFLSTVLLGCAFAVAPTTALAERAKKADREAEKTEEPKKKVGKRSGKKAELSVAEQYELGQRYLKRGYYVKAMETFNRIRNYHRDDPMAVDAELAIADLHYEKSEWDQARLTYEDFVRMHPRHERVDYVMFRIGETLFRKSPKAAGRDQTWARQAVNTWAGFGDRFPDSEYLEEVTDKLDRCRERLALKELQIARFYDRREAWRAVEGRTSGLLRTHPDSTHVPEALSLLAVAHAWLGDAEAASDALSRLETADPDLARRAAERVKRAKPDDPS